jgi:hypothetical protein
VRQSRAAGRNVNTDLVNVREDVAESKELFPDVANCRACGQATVPQ